MSKIFLSLLIFGTLAGCNKPNPDFITLENAIIKPDVDIVGGGTADDVFIKIPATDEIMAIVAHGKKTVFWSDLESESIVKHAQSGTCLVDAKIDYAGNCPYRLYCGGETALMIAMSVNSAYATEVCK